MPETTHKLSSYWRATFHELSSVLLIPPAALQEHLFLRGATQLISAACEKCMCRQEYFISTYTSASFLLAHYMTHYFNKLFIWWRYATCNQNRSPVSGGQFSRTTTCNHNRSPGSAVAGGQFSRTPSPSASKQLPVKLSLEAVLSSQVHMRL